MVFHLIPRLHILYPMSLTVARERRSWTAKEDQLLRDAVQKGPPTVTNLSLIYSPIPQRTQTMRTPPNGMLLQSMSQTEPTRIVESVGLPRWQTMWSRAVGLHRKMRSWWRALNDMGHGVLLLFNPLQTRQLISYFRWSLVASVVQSRNSDRQSSTTSTPRLQFLIVS